MKTILVVGCALLLACASWQLANACGAEHLRAVFSYSRHPDLPRTTFIDGQLGILRPTFARSYLVLAYRHLSGVGLNASEREQARDFYKDRATDKWDHLDVNWQERWMQARSAINSPASPRVNLLTRGTLAYNAGTNSFVPNCLEDAFRTAYHRLEEHKRQFGLSSRATRSWVEAQDAVFHNCDGHDKRLPPPASPDLPASIRLDRDYQIAAARFYAGNYDHALAGFRQIGTDRASPWRPISRYLVLRTLFRAAAPDREDQLKPQLEQEGAAILTDSSLRPIHGMTLTLLHRYQVRSASQKYFDELGSLLSARGQDNGLREELWNFTALYDNIIGDSDPNTIYRSMNYVPADPKPFHRVDLTDWIFTFQSKDKGAFEHALTRWQQLRTEPWLLCALSKATGTQALRAGLIDAATTIPVSSPAFTNVRFQLVVLYLQLGETTKARSIVDDLLNDPRLRSLPSSLNQVRALRVSLAPDLRDLLSFALQKPVLITTNANIGEAPNFEVERQRPVKQPVDYINLSGAQVLNYQTPLRELQQAALSAALPSHTQREVASTALLRGLMLDQDSTPFLLQLASLNTEFSDLARDFGSSDVAGKRFLTAFFILHHPEVRPYLRSGVSREAKNGRLDPYRDNWWCPMDVPLDFSESPATPTRLEHSVIVSSPEFLAQQSAAMRQEWDQLQRAGNGAEFLAKIVFAYAQVHPTDARVTEALYWLIRAGHYGCGDTDTSKVTRSAFRLLQTRYAKTIWAKQTPTWSESNSIREEIKRPDQDQ